MNQDLDKMWKTLMERASKEKTPFSEVLDAFKAGVAYYALLSKQKKSSNDDGDEATFDNFRNALNGAEDEDGRKVRGRRRDA